MTVLKWISLFFIFLLPTVHAKVTVKEEQFYFLLENDRLSVRVDKMNGKVSSLKYKGQELLSEDGGYWGLSGASNKTSDPSDVELKDTIEEDENDNIEVAERPNNMNRFTAFTRVQSSKIVKDTGKIVDIMLEAAVPARGIKGWPVAYQFHYVLQDSSSALAIYADLTHPAGAPASRLGEGRFVVKPSAKLFDSLWIDEKRGGKMPTGYDWDHATKLNVKEARRLTTGEFKGKAEHKYDYSALLAETPAYGWSSTLNNVGIWMINPSSSYLAGGPVKVELTGHRDVNIGGLPVLLNMWHGSHYGGCSLVIAQEENWQKRIGPFLIYVNADKSGKELWQEATAEGIRQRGKFPYSFCEDGKTQGAIKGNIIVKDPLDPTVKPSNMMVGLTRADYTVNGKTINWSKDGKFPQYWVRADANGRFAIAHVPEGTYTLRAYANGVLGEYSHEKVIITKGKTLDAKTITWQPFRYGKTIWDIGIPNRTAEEFFRADTYFEWGNYFKFSTDFPNGVDYTIGKSDFRKDWNYCQPPMFQKNGQIKGSSTFKINFNLTKIPNKNPMLRIVLCGYRGDGALFLGIDNKPYTTTGRFDENGVMHRDGIRGLLTEFTFPLDVKRLKVGENTLSLISNADVWHKGILYDYIRLEENEK